MTTFLDGPAKGQRLIMLHRAARFLRVCEEKGKWDALDQLTDSPKAEETLHAYEIAGPVGMCHIRASGGRGGFYPIAEYRMVVPQPTDKEMRDTKEWHDWCVARAASSPIENQKSKI